MTPSTETAIRERAVSLCLKYSEGPQTKEQWAGWERCLSIITTRLEQGYIWMFSEGKEYFTMATPFADLFNEQE